MPTERVFFLIVRQLNKDRCCPEGVISIIILYYIGVMLVIPKVPLHSFLHLITERAFQEVSSQSSDIFPFICGLWNYPYLQKCSF